VRSRLKALLRRVVDAKPESWISFFVLVALVLFTFQQLHPSLIFSKSTPTGGDMGAHVWSGTYLRDHLLTHGRLSGWTPDWYAGAPAFHFYMVVPFLLILALDVVLPYTIAFKLVAVSGVLALPIAVWAFGKLAGLRFPGPPLLAIAATLFLFDTRFDIYGGNIASTMAGEFAFAISLSLAFLYFGVLARGLRTGRHRALAAVLLALVGLCHVIPAILAVAGTAVMLLLHWRRPSFRWLLTTVPVAAMLGAFWALPFAWRRAYMNDMGWEKLQPWVGQPAFGGGGRSLTDWLHDLVTGDAVFSPWLARVGDSLWPWDLRWAWLLALVGLAGGIAGRKRPHLFLGAMTLALAVSFVLLPQGRLWNARLLPFYYLCIYLLAALGVTEVLRALTARFLAHREDLRTWILRLAPAVGMVVALVFLGMQLRVLDFDEVPVLDRLGGHTDTSDNTYHFLGMTSRADNKSDGWAKWNFTGYEGRVPNASGGGYHEYHDLIETMADVGADHGCGRAMWEYEPELVRYGTPMALMLLPHWTDGCIGSMEGLYFETSATTPYHFLNQSELSAVPSRAQRGLPYGTLDVSRGVQHLQMLGVRYYLTTSQTATEQADHEEDLTELATSGPWTIYEVADSDLVAPLENEPAVWTDVADGQSSWLEPSVDWYLDSNAQDVFMAADGPPEWQRVAVGETPERIPVDQVEVTDIEAGDDRISFDVDQIGQPVLVRASYFPNWQVSGASGPYRVTPNLMVVVPTSTHVSLHYGWTPVDLLGWFLTLLGIAGVVVLWRRPPVEVPTPSQPLEVSVFGPTPDVVDEDELDDLPERSPPEEEEEDAPEAEPDPDEVPVGAGD
jgi:hypothetical protein